MEVEKLTLLQVLVAMLAGVGGIGYAGWNGPKTGLTPTPKGPDMNQQQWNQFCDWLRAFPLIKPPAVPLLCLPVVLGYEEDPAMPNTFKVKLGFSGNVPTPDPNDPNSDKDPIVSRRVELTVTPLAGGDAVVSTKDFDIADPIASFTGVPQNSRVKVGAAYVNSDGVPSSEFTYLPEFEVVDKTGPVNLTEDITVETEEE